MRMVYFAYPIDNGGPSMERHYPRLEKAKAALLDAGVDVVYDPGDAFTLRAGSQPGDEADWINRRAATEADGLFAFLPTGVASIGVPIEIDRALSQGKWVALCSDVNSWMLQDARRGMGRFGLADEDLRCAVEWLAQQIDSPYPLGKKPEPLPVRRLDEHAVLPHRQYQDDAGLDLVVSSGVRVPPGQSVDVRTSVAMQLPPWAWGLIIGRSSTRRSKGLLVHPGVIDSGWRGELFINVENQTPDYVEIGRGERIAQIILIRNETMKFEPMWAETLGPHPRGTNGFGSTGR